MSTPLERVLLATTQPAKFMIEYPTTCPVCGDTFDALDIVIAHQIFAWNGRLIL